MKNKTITTMLTFIMLIFSQSILFLSCPHASWAVNQDRLTNIQRDISKLNERYNWHKGRVDTLKESFQYAQKEDQKFIDRYKQFIATPEGQEINSLLTRQTNNKLSETERNNILRQQLRHSHLRGTPYPFEFEIWAENPDERLKDAWKEYQNVAEWYTASAARLSRYETELSDAEQEMSSEINSLVSDLRNQLQQLRQTGADGVLIKRFENEIADILGQKDPDSGKDIKPWTREPAKDQEEKERETEDKHAKARVSFSIANVKQIVNSKESKHWTFDRNVSMKMRHRHR